jgi:two-component system, LytTR family, response regulator
MIKLIIIDDQESYRQKLKKLLEKSGKELAILGEAPNADEGLKLIAKVNPDLVFLDIEMPGGSGFDMLRQIRQVNFDVIFTTAHNEFGIQAIKFSALDYLMKPIDLDELNNAIEKHIEKKRQSTQQKQFDVLFQHLQSVNSTSNQIGLPTSSGLIFVKLNDIIRCQSAINYTDFFLVDKSKITVSRTLKETESLLAEKHFFRVHDSHLINLHHIKRYMKGEGGIAVMADGSEIDVSRRKKDEFKQRLAVLKMTFD